MVVKSTKSKAQSLKANFRIYILVFFVFVGATAIILRLYFLQVRAHAYYQELAADQHKIYQDLIPRRGQIFARDGAGYYPVAVNQELNLVYAVPKEIENPRATAGVLAQILQLDERDLEAKIDQPDGWYAVIQHKVSDDQVNQIKEKKMNGIHFSPEPQRFYPGGSFASQVVGFVGSNGEKTVGRYGLEAFYNQELEGIPGNLEQEQDTGGRWISISDKKIHPAQNGADLFLSIDHTVQYRAEMAIKKAIEKYQADRGSMVIIDPATGGVIAMASTPDFNLNDFSRVEDISVFSNPVVSEAYECGSIFKAITMAGGVDAKVVTPDTTYTDTGEVREAGYTMKNSDLKTNGVQTMTQVLEKSLNTGVIYVEKLLGNARFLDYVKDFGFGAKTGIDTIGEAAGNLSGLESMRSINAFTASFGQGLSVTPLQMAASFATIANGGNLMQPHLVEKIKYADGREENLSRKKSGVLFPGMPVSISRGCSSALLKNGHGKRAAVPGYLVAGKTGTAQVPKANGGGYEEDQHIGSFAGFAPAFDPKFAMLVKLDNPKNVEWAESSAAPTFGEMAKFLLDYYSIEPTEQYSQKEVDLFNATHDVSIYQTPKEEAAPTPPPAPVEEKKEKKKKH